MVWAMMIVTVLVIATILIHYEILRATANHLGELPIRPHLRIIVVVVAAFFAHTLEVWLYAGAYIVLAEHLGFGRIAGEPIQGFQDYLYFSVITYSSVGYGDHYPTGHLRLLAGVEALNGLVLIGWSASFTYLAMQKYWPLHDRRRGGHKKRVRLIEEVVDDEGGAAGRQHDERGGGDGAGPRRSAQSDHRR